ncbi:carbohydrate ABC transporter permease [Gorillibacterium massiliense]|uniref:carbohydrate ABC transporter permease n=1 Tax=Gorillibacterium massiliense TaxID=1280390 RepID=UPI0004B53E9D|nr:carbohydrate ABC transporter permease [Gorillibacterium massiliense]
MSANLSASDKQAARSSRKKKTFGATAISAKSNFVINVIFALYSLACLVPLLLVIIISFTDENTVLVHGYSFLPQKLSLEAYRFMFKDWHQIVQSYGVSIFVTIVGTALSILIMSLFAYPISRKDFPHRNKFAFFMFFTMLFNGGLVPWYLVYTQIFHMKNMLWALIMPLLVSAFLVMIIRTFFSNSIPGELLESGKIDGAGEFRIFFQIVIPLSLPVLATVGLFQTLAYWNDWFNSMVFIDGVGNHNVSLQFLMYKTMLDIQFLSSNSTAAAEIAKGGGYLSFPQETVRMAMAVLGIGPIILAYPFFQRYFIAGLTVGAVKG